MPENPVATELADVRTLAPLARARIIMFGMTRHWAKKNVCVFGEKSMGVNAYQWRLFVGRHSVLAKSVISASGRQRSGKRP